MGAARPGHRRAWRAPLLMDSRSGLERCRSSGSLRKYAVELLRQQHELEGLPWPPSGPIPACSEG